MVSNDCTIGRGGTTGCVGGRESTVIDETSRPGSARSSGYAGRNACEYNRQDAGSDANADGDGVESSDQNPADLPDYDRAHKTRTQCMLATLLGTLFSAALLALGTTAAVRDPHTLAPRLPIRSTSTWLEAVSLAVNILIGFSQDGMTFAHAASQRWALLAEGRLLTHARASSAPPNRWPANAASLASLVLCYGGSSVLFVSGEPEDLARDLACWDLGFQLGSKWTRRTPGSAARPCVRWAWAWACRPRWRGGACTSIRTGPAPARPCRARTQTRSTRPSRRPGSAS